MQPQEFVAKWHNVTVNESQGAQTFFNDICALVDHPDIVSIGNPDVFTFEKWVPGGFADACFLTRWLYCLPGLVYLSLIWPR